MQIIHTPPQQSVLHRLWRGTCQKCSSLVEAEQGELTYHEKIDDGNNQCPEHCTGMCPKCKTVVMKFFPHNG
jgi:hypothetical protein